MRLKSIKLFDFLDKNKDKEISFEDFYNEKISNISLKIIALNTAISYIADIISKCNFDFYINGKIQKYDELDFLFNINPSNNISGPSLKRNLIFKLFLDGRALIFEKSGKLYLADSFFREEHPLNEDLFTEISIKNETNVFSRKASEVFYFQLDNLEIKKLINGLFEDYKDLISTSISSYRNKEKYKLKIDRTSYDSQTFEDEYNNFIKVQLKEFIENPKSVYPEYKGFSLEPIQLNSNNSNSSNDFIQLKKDIFETVAIAFKMPVSFLYGNMTNVKDLITSYITFAIEPLTKMVESEITRKIFSVEEYKNKSYCSIDTKKIIHVDIFENSDKIEKLISSGHSNIDEVRDLTGYEPLNTKFSMQHWMTKNFAKIEELLKQLDEGGEKDEKNE